MGIDVPRYESKSLVRAEVPDEASLEGLLDWKYLSLGRCSSTLRFLGVNLNMILCRAFEKKFTDIFYWRGVYKDM